MKRYILTILCLVVVFAGCGKKKTISPAQLKGLTLSEYALMHEKMHPPKGPGLYSIQSNLVRLHPGKVPYYTVVGKVFAEPVIAEITPYAYSFIVQTAGAYSFENVQLGSLTITTDSCEVPVNLSVIASSEDGHIHVVRTDCFVLVDASIKDETMTVKNEWGLPSQDGMVSFTNVPFQSNDTLKVPNYRAIGITMKDKGIEKNREVPPGHSF